MFFHNTVYTRNKEKQQTQLDKLFLILCMCLTQMIQVPRIGEDNLCLHWRWAWAPRTPPTSKTSTHMIISQTKEIRNRANADAEL